MISFVCQISSKQQSSLVRFRKGFEFINFLMISLQVTLSDFRSRKRQFIPVEPLNVILRFGSIKLQIKLASNGDQLLGGKRILLDLSPDQLKDLFLNYALGMFVQNQQGRFFSILSLEKLDLSDIVSGQQVYFYNDNQEIFYSAHFSLIFNGYNNPRLPNKDKIQNHKTFDQFFKKPAVPTHQVPAKTLSSFLYSKKIQHSQNQVHKLSSTGGKVSKPKPSSANKNTKLSATSTKKMSKTKKVPEFSATSHPQIQIYNPYDGNQQQEDENPPMMQFTNTVADQSRGINLLKTQMAELNLTAPESIKFMTAYDSKNGFLKGKTKDSSRNTIIKIQEKLQSGQQGSLRETKSFKENMDSIKVNRDELRIKAKQEMEAYQGNSNIKIPVLKDGKYELVELALLNEQEIADFAKRQKELEMEEEKKRMAQKQLQKKEKQNSLLKKQLEEKERLLQKQQEQAKRQKIQLLKAQQLAQENKKLALATKVVPKPQPPSDSYDDDEDEDKYDQDGSQKKDSQKEQQENYYQSDFQSMSMASAQKKSRISMNSQKKLEESQSYNDYNESYDPDFESYSQSLLGSQQKLSMSQISESLKNYSPKRR